MKGALNEQKSEHLGQEEGTPDKSKCAMKAGSEHTVDQSSPGEQTRNGDGERKQGQALTLASRSLDL